MKKRFVIDLARWERGEMRLEELMAAHGADCVIDLAETHAWVSFLATEPQGEPGPDWATLSAQLAPRPVARRRTLHFRRLVTATMAGFLLTPATAYALGDGTVGRLFTTPVNENDQVASPGPHQPPPAREDRIASVPSPSDDGSTWAPPAPQPGDVPVPSTAPPAAPPAPGRSVAVEAPARRGSDVSPDTPAPVAEVDEPEAPPVAPDPAPETPEADPEPALPAEVAPDDSGVDDGWETPPDEHPGNGHGPDGETGAPSWSNGRSGSKPKK